MENDAEIFPVHYTWKVAEKGFKMASMMNRLAMINSCGIILKINLIFCQNLLCHSGAHNTCMHIILDKIWYIQKLNLFNI